MLSLAMLASLAVAPSSAAFAEAGVKAYVADRTGIVSSYEGNYSGHNSTTNASAFKWGNYGGNWESEVRNYPDKGLENVFFAGANGKADSASVVLAKPFSAADVKKVVVLARAEAKSENAELPWNMYYLSGTEIGATWGAQNGTADGTLKFVADKKYKEYEFSTASGFKSWSGEKQKLRMTMKGSDFPVTLDIAHIRFVDDTYGQEAEVNNGSGGNNHLNDIVRFEFLKELDPDTVKAENIQLNGVPATYVIENKAADSAKSLRVRLGTLTTATRYTVTFSGLKYADGTAVEEVFKFATENESIPVYPENLKAYSTARTGIAAAWEGTAADEYRFGNGKWTSAVCEFDEAAGTDKIKFPSKDNNHAFFKLASPVSGAENITKMVIGMKTDQDVDLKLYYVTGTQLQGFAETHVAKYISAKKGDGGFKEYSVPISSSFTGFADGMRSFRITPSGADESPVVDYEKGLNLEIAYIRFVTDEYQTRAAQMQNFAKDYNTELTDSVRFLFEKDLDAATVKTENILINGKNAVDVFDVKDNVACVRFGRLPSISRCRVTFPGMKYADGTAVDEQFVFTTTNKGLINKEMPAATYELVSGFETENEAVLKGAVPSGKITAVTGGLRNIAEEKKRYALYIALYDGDMLINVDCKYITLEAGEAAGQQDINVTVPEKQEGDSDNRYSVKAFLWEADTQIPCIDAITPSNNGM